MNFTFIFRGEQKVKKIISILLAVICVMSAGLISTSALENDSVELSFGKPYEMGDFNYDFKLNIMDVTDIQRYLVGSIWLSDLGVALGDVDHDDELTIFDATVIQKKLAGICDFEVEENPDHIIRYAYVDIMSFGDEPETVRVGEALEISTIVSCDSVHYTEFLAFDYTFNCTLEFPDKLKTDITTIDGSAGIVLPTAGKYILTMEVTDEFGDYARRVYEFEVVE